MVDSTAARRSASDDAGAAIAGEGDARTGAPAAGTSADTPQRSSSLGEHVLRWWPVAVWIAVEALLVDAVRVAVSRPWLPSNDWAIIDDQVRSVGGATPLIGAFSRYGWRHPGPWMFWLLAIPYRVGGSSPNGILVGAALLNAAAIAGIAVTVLRRGGRIPYAATMFAIVVYLHTVGVALLIDPWNTWVPFLPFVWLMFLVWDATCGRRWAIPWVVGVGSFVVQCHVGYAVPVLFLLAWVGVRAWLDRRHASPGQPAGVRVALVVAAVVVVLWLPVAIDQVTASDGNASQLWNFFVHDEQAGGRPTSEVAVGLDQGVKIVANETAGWPPWLGAKEIIDQPEAQQSSASLLLLPFVALGCVWWLGRQRGSVELKSAAVTGAVGLVAAVVATTRIVGAPFHWLTRFIWAVAIFVDVVVVWAAASVILDQPPLRRRRGSRRWALVGATASLVAIIGVTLFTLGDAGDAKLPLEVFTPAVEGVGGPLVAKLRADGYGSVLVSSWAKDNGVISAAVIDQLDAAGITVYADDEYGVHFPDQYRSHGHRYDATVEVVAGDELIDSKAGSEGREPAVRWDPGPADGDLIPVAVFITPSTELATGSTQPTSTAPS